MQVFYEAVKSTHEWIMFSAELILMLRILQVYTEKSIIARSLKAQGQYRELVSFWIQRLRYCYHDFLNTFYDFTSIYLVWLLMEFEFFNWWFWLCFTFVITMSIYMIRPFVLTPGFSFKNPVMLMFKDQGGTVVRFLLIAEYYFLKKGDIGMFLWAQLAFGITDIVEIMELQEIQDFDPDFHNVERISGLAGGLTLAAMGTLNMMLIPNFSYTTGLVFRIIMTLLVKDVADRAMFMRTLGWPLYPFQDQIPHFSIAALAYAHDHPMDYLRGNEFYTLDFISMRCHEKFDRWIMDWMVNNPVLVRRLIQAQCVEQRINYDDISENFVHEMNELAHDIMLTEALVTGVEPAAVDEFLERIVLPAGTIVLDHNGGAE